MTLNILLIMCYTDIKGRRSVQFIPCLTAKTVSCSTDDWLVGNCYYCCDIANVVFTNSGICFYSFFFMFFYSCIMYVYFIIIIAFKLTSYWCYLITALSHIFYIWIYVLIVIFFYFWNVEYDRNTICRVLIYYSVVDFIFFING